MSRLAFYVNWAASSLFGLISARKYSAEWRAVLDDLLNKYSDSAVVDDFCIKLGAYDIWIENRYYAYGHHYGPGYDFEFRPSIKTMYRLACLEHLLTEKRQQAKQAEYYKQFRSSDK